MWYFIVADPGSRETRWSLLTNLKEPRSTPQIAQLLKAFEKDYGQEALSYSSMPICALGTHKNKKSLFHHYYEVWMDFVVWSAALRWGSSTASISSVSSLSFVWVCFISKIMTPICINCICGCFLYQASPSQHTSLAPSFQGTQLVVNCEQNPKPTKITIACTLQGLVLGRHRLLTFEHTSSYWHSSF